MSTYNFTTIARLIEQIYQGTAILKLTPNPNGSYYYELKTSFTGVHCPNVFDIKGVGFLSGKYFSSSYKGYILNFDMTTGILNASDLQQTFQIQGTTTPQPEPEPTPNPSSMTDTNYNTYNNFTGSCCKCGKQGSSGTCGVTNIINLNNRND